MKPKLIQDAIIDRAALITTLAAACWLDEAICWLATGANLLRVIDGFYALAGFAATLSIPLAFATHITCFDSVVLTSGPSSSWTMAGAVLAMAGLFHLFRRQPAARRRVVSAAP